MGDTTTSIGTYLEKMPEKHKLFPEASELRLILGGLQEIYDDIAVPSHVGHCAEEARHRAEFEPEIYEPDVQWFREQMRKFE